MKELLTKQEPTGAEYLKAIIALGSKVYQAAQITPLQPMEKLSARLGNQVLIKREDRQPVHSFKLRGAYAMMSSLTETQRKAGIIAASAGNHAQGVALSAKLLGLKALIVMPQNTPKIKVEAVQAFGGEVLLFGANFDEAKAKAIALSESEKMSFIPPFDHPMVIAGQGTLALEMLQQYSELDRIFVPVGGGGMAAGVAVLIKQLMPEIKVIGVESKDSACLYAAFQAGKPVDLERVGLFADGVAVKRIGNETFRLCQQYLDDLVLVDSDEVCAAMKDVFENVRAIAEPSGALALAGLKKYAKEHALQNENLATVLSGANLNFHTLRYVSERCEIGEKREALLAVTIPEQKGSFLTFCHLLGDRAVTEFNYRYSDTQQACIFVGVRTQNESEKSEIIAELSHASFAVEDMSNDEVAKTHIRYMIGGRTNCEKQERLYSFEFPEQKGALLKFLEKLGTHWNISLFHYRNHGADYGNILAGFQFEQDDFNQFEQHLSELAYAYQDVTESKAYRFFLK
ncbi:threonine ammonia-lyase, biosynthetic [Mergibacter septicus]|uniref:threonine ammonia-lyase, biosynthetic n=1 Tax=Mergibacter septicus TaxID=221402 RepID=UPI001C79175B|nr:threonine ammonia-lyase, biosynthetic [Mergibacter septicus]QDJ13011.1 threonine ammonia-lyase, biosynthetic [Mergibacter septicus]